jgi:UDP-N-acetylmuramate dehydrogenase
MTDISASELRARAKAMEPLSRYTTARVGGPADLLVEARTTEELLALAQRADAIGMPCHILGSGANVLVSDQGVRGLVVVNRAREIRWKSLDGSARVEVDSGVALITLARECIERGLGGLEWAIGVPGTVGGAVVGNAGAHGSDVNANLVMAKILRRGALAPEWWTKRQLGFGYRVSALKQYQPAERPIVLTVLFDLKHDNRANLERRAGEYNDRRRASQPPGATMGSMFKNPSGDFAGRLIEAAGLKGHRQGLAQISEKHANFFVNTGGASAVDVKALIDLAQAEVLKQFAIRLELEVELLGDWGGGPALSGVDTPLEIEN